MSINYTLDIVDILVVADYNDMSDVVREVLWTVTGVDSVTGTTAVSNEQTILPYPADTFINFSDLTKDQVLSWVQLNHCLSMESLQASLQKQIEATDAPELVSKTLSN